MRVLVDGFNTSLKKGTGVATYARNLSFALKRNGANVTFLYEGNTKLLENELLQEIDFFDRVPAKGFSKRLMKLRGPFDFIRGAYPKKVPFHSTVIFEQFKSQMPAFDELYTHPGIFSNSYRNFKRFAAIGSHFQLVLLEAGFDLAHWTYPIPLKLNKAANVYTIHDLVPLRLPYTTMDNKRDYLRLVSKIADTADLILTVSETSKTDITRILKVDERRVCNTYQSVRLPNLVRSEPDRLRGYIEETLGLKPNGYLIYYGAIEPKKNVDRLVQAYLSSGSSLPLLLVGDVTWHKKQPSIIDDIDRWSYYQRIGDKIVRKERIYRLTYVPFSLLVSLVANARAILFPSLYEGFGLPILEAMSLGTPVVTSNIGANAEISAAAALLVDPYNLSEIANGIKQISEDDDLCKHLVAQGQSRASFFSEEEYARRLAAAYSKL